MAVFDKVLEDPEGLVRVAREYQMYVAGLKLVGRFLVRDLLLCRLDVQYLTKADIVLLQLLGIFLEMVSEILK